MEKSRGATPVSVEDPVAHSVSVQLPVFNRLAPSAWFNLEDANFHLRGISKSDTKYWYVVSKLDQDTLQKLTAFLARPRGEDPYTEIRQLLCQTYEPTLEQKLDQLLAKPTMGDERPSEFELELRRLCDNASTEDILKRVFIQGMPHRLKDAVSANIDGTLDALVRAADRAWALNAGSYQGSVSAVTSGIPEPGSSTTVSAIATPSSVPARGRGSRQRGGRQGRQEQGRSKAVVLCPFHLKWGDSARRCLPSCSRWEARTPQQVFQVVEDDQYTAS